MERVLVKRLYRDNASQNAVLLMELAQTKECFKIKLPCQRVGVLALEAHGLNDRCPLYGMFLECFGILGAVFGAVVISCKDPQYVTGAISVSYDGRITWVDADVVELVAFALHSQIPLYVKRPEEHDTLGETSSSSSTEIPSVFEAALENILTSDSGPGPVSTDSSTL